MKKHLLLLLPLSILLLACSKERNPKSLAEIKDPTSADSMMYFLGEMNAAAYWQDADADTTLRTQEARDEFIEGFKDAIKLDKESEAYNKGLQLGLRLGVRLRELHNRYGIDFPKDILAAGLKNSLQEDNRSKVAETQAEYYKIKDRLELEAGARELEVASRKLAKEGHDRGFEMVSDTLYAIDVTPAGPGPKFKDGDRVAVYVSASTLDGNEIVARQFPDSITIGAGRVPRIVCLGLHTMTNGQTRTFMTTPRTLFGKRYATYHLPYDEPVLFTVKVEQN